MDSGINELMLTRPTIRSRYAFSWNHAGNLPSREFNCGHCGAQIASERGYSTQGINVTAAGPRHGYIYICHKCTRPTFFDLEGNQVPGTPFGESLPEIDNRSVNDVYEEARRATSANCYTAAVLCCRKLLMHIAVAKGAVPGETFADYVDYLANKNFVPPDARAWVDHIRKMGNEANHDIVIVKREDAEELLKFVEMLLTLVFVFPATVKKKYSPKAPAPATSAAKSS